jgi:hypothetical protein
MLTASFVNISGNLDANVAAMICPAPNTVCSVLIISNTGASGMTVKYGSAPASGADGIPVTAGDVLTLTAEQVSQSDPVFALSTVGMTFHVAQGVGLVARR